MQEVPRYKWSNMKPDWNAPELVEGTGTGLYYESRRYIGRLYREVQLSVPRVRAPPACLVSEPLSSSAILECFRSGNFTPRDPIETAVHKRVAEFMDVDLVTRRTIQRIEGLTVAFNDYVQTLRHISVSFNISHRRTARLMEEEIVAGTIVAQSSQPRIRNEAMSQMREQGSILVNRIAVELAGPEEEDKFESLKRAWIAYRISTLRPDAFGFRSFGLLAMHEVFDAIKSIEVMRRFSAGLDP